MIQCNVATGHYPIREIVLRALISETEIHNPACCPLIGQLSPCQASDWLRPSDMMCECQSMSLITSYRDCSVDITQIGTYTHYTASWKIPFSINPPDMALFVFVEVFGFRQYFKIVI